ncbi:MAG: DUF3422 domain-containing protein, partial [Methylococcales bacterium]|nr:DUF3422 domain-containing protein [Methylococcales bacterium]
MTKIPSIPDNHPQRFILHNEVHARTPIVLKRPVRSSLLALTLSNEEKKREHAYISVLCDRYGVMPPKEDSSHFSATLDSFQFRWEQHAEFSAYSFYVQNTPDDPFTKPALEQVPIDWLDQLPGKVIVAAHAVVIDKSHSSATNTKSVSALFSGNPIVGAEVTGSAARAYTDFKIHADGFSRFLIVDNHLKSEQAGRLLQRLFEIEIYRVMALLAFPIAKQLTPELITADKQLLSITTVMAQSGSNDGELLDELTTLAAQVENNISAHQYR